MASFEANRLAAGLFARCFHLADLFGSKMLAGPLRISETEQELRHDVLVALGGAP
jgi:hypothetical protein